MDNQIQNALVTAIGQALSVVPADDVARCAARLLDAAARDVGKNEEQHAGTAPPEHAHAHSSTAQPHAHAHAHARGMAHGARRRAGGRAGSTGGRFGWYGKNILLSSR